MLKSCFIEGPTLDDVWFQLLRNCYDHGRINNITDGSFAGAKRLEFDYVSGTIYFPTERPLAPIMPDGVPPVTTDNEIEKYFINYLMDGHNLADNEHYRYSTWVSGGRYKLPKSEIEFYDRGFFECKNQPLWDVVITVPNQIQWCIDHYKSKGFGNNHACIQVGYPESSFAYDIPWKDESERQTSPCLRLIDTHIKEDEGEWKLCFAVAFRSWDLFAGFPENMGGITMLQEYMANELGVKVGSLSFSSLKCHTYDFAIEPLKLRLGVE